MIAGLGCLEGLFSKKGCMQGGNSDRKGLAGIPLLIGAKGYSQRVHHPCLGIVKWDFPSAVREMASIWPPVVRRASTPH